MATFLGDDYLLNSTAAKDLWQAAKDLPIIDAHNHADVPEIRANDNYPDIWQIEGATDHYVWSALRTAGVPERYLTGDATNEEKWMAMAAAFPKLATNPTYEWVHLDLKRLLGIDELINADTAESIWNETKAILAKPEMRPQQLLETMKVEVMCSTDDPVDTLSDHQALVNSDMKCSLRPTFRPDKALNIFKPEWREYIESLETRWNTSCDNIDDLLDVLRQAHDFFAENGCMASDHGVEIPYGYDVDKADADRAFKHAKDGKELHRDEHVAYMSYMLQEMAALDAEKDWVFQVHLGAVRNVRDFLMENIGPDSGGDVCHNLMPVTDPLCPLLNRFDGKLKVVLYCLDPTLQATLATLTRAFGEKVNLGSAWWFNDTPEGMRRQMRQVSGIDILSSHVGMVSDSRKLLSYASRHEMFRRCLSDVLGEMVEEGRVPASVAEDLVVDLSYARPKRFFGF